MEIDARRINEVIVMRLQLGSAERGKIDGVQTLVREHLSAGTLRFIVDLEGCQWIDSSGLGELVRSLVAVMRQGGNLKLSGVSPRMRNVLEVTNLTSVFEIYPNEAAALESYIR